MHRASAAFTAFLCLVLQASAVAENLPRPPQIEPAVRFWIKVYAQVSTEGGLIHDRDNLAIIYERIGFDEGASRPARREHVRARQRHYRAVLETLASGRRDDLSHEQRRVLELFPAGVDNARLRRAANNIRFQLGQADRFRRGLIRAGAWEPHIRRTIEDMGLPPELAALPHVESSFNPDAYSRVGAAGLWQFTRATGRRFMRVDHIVDERMDPFQSSIAAARLLKHNHSVTGDWALAITAYNHGLAGIRRAVRATGSDDIADLIREYRGRNWGFASRNFYPAFLAAVDVDFSAHKHFGLIERVDPLISETIEMPFYAAVEDVLAAFDVGLSELRELNRALRPPVWNGEKRIPRGYELRVPSGPERPPAAEMLARIDPERRFYAQIPDRYHTVRRGESLSTIAQRYDVPVSEIAAVNNLHNTHLIRVGQRLRLPGRGSGPIDGRIYVVERGDNLSRIAARAGMTVGALAAANRLDPDRPIQPGQELRVDGRGVEGAGEIAIAEAATSARGEAADAVAATSAAEQEAGNEGEDAAGQATATRAGQAVVERTPPAAALDSETPAPGPSVRVYTTDQVLARMRMTSGGAADGAGTNGIAAFFGPPAALAAPGSMGSAAERGPRTSLASSDELAADPSDYSVAADGTIEIQAAETLGHYAEWLDLRASQLRRINDMRYATPVVIGHRLALDFRHVAPGEFERRRRAHHQALQARFFEQFRITGTESREIQSGDSLWTLALRHDNVPVWLLRQYNPDLDFDRLRPGMAFTLPTLERQPGPEGEDTLAAGEG